MAGFVVISGGFDRLFSVFSGCVIGEISECFPGVLDVCSECLLGV